MRNYASVTLRGALARGVRRPLAPPCPKPRTKAGRILGVFWEDSGNCREDIILSQPLPALSQKFPAISQLYFSCGYSPPARLRFAAEASKNLENAESPLVLLVRGHPVRRSLFVPLKTFFAVFPHSGSRIKSAKTINGKTVKKSLIIGLFP